jgi:hypothetical protein
MFVVRAVRSDAELGAAVVDPQLVIAAAYGTVGLG